jgi:hypothetical protein
MPGPDFVIDEINGNPDMWKNFSLRWAEIG